MNPAAKSAARKSRPTAAVSARGFGGNAGTTRSDSFGGFARPRPSRRTIAATRKRPSLRTLEPLPYDDADRNEESGRQEPRDETLGHRADVADRPAAAVVGMLDPVDVADDRVELPVRDRLRRELRHDVRADAHRLGDLHVGRILERRRQRAGDDAALRDHL